MSPRSRNIIKLAIFAVLVAGVAGLFFSPLRGYLSTSRLHGTIDQMRGLWYAPFALILAYGIGCIFAAPATVFIVAAGVVWGWKLGTAYAMAGGLLGASLSYFVGRFLGEGLLDRFGRAGAAVKSQVENGGFKALLIARLIPGPPFAVWNYGAGVARMKFGDYFFATLLGTLPAHLVMAYSADAIFNGTLSGGAAFRRLVVVMLLLLAAVLVPTLVKRRMERASRAQTPSSGSDPT
ncbi:MAG: VTT domain-containing protein [Acidobacteriota bacterium]